MRIKRSTPSEIEDIIINAIIWIPSALGFVFWAMAGRHLWSMV